MRFSVYPGDQSDEVTMRANAMFRAIRSTGGKRSSRFDASPRHAGGHWQYAVTRLGVASRSVTGAAVLLSGLVFAPVAAADLGDDGLHKQPWFALTFKDVTEDIADAAADGKRLAIVFEQAGCVYCEKMHATVLNDPEVVEYLSEHYVVVQYNLYGDEEVVDTDGEVLTEKSAAEKWGVMFTPNWLFLPATLDGVEGEPGPASEVAVGSMPGAFGKGTFLDLFTWVYDEGYEGDEGFQRYHARRIAERQAAGGADVATD